MTSGVANRFFAIERLKLYKIKWNVAASDFDVANRFFAFERLKLNHLTIVLLDKRI